MINQPSARPRSALPAVLPTGPASHSCPTGRPTSGLPDGLTTRTFRPIAVCNGYGEHLASFTEWEIAHAWAHLNAKEPNAILPIEIDDRTQRITRRVTRESCELIVWAVFHREGSCLNGPSRIRPYLREPR